MSDLARFHQIATRLHQEEADLAFEAIPYHARNGYHSQTGGYVCRDNGIGCGRDFPTREAKYQHQLVCKYTTARSSDRLCDTSRMMGG
jgi:hypothetical protein